MPKGELWGDFPGGHAAEIPPGIAGYSSVPGGGEELSNGMSGLVWPYLLPFPYHSLAPGQVHWQRFFSA